MSPPVQRDGKPVKKLNRRESSGFAFCSWLRLLFEIPSPFETPCCFMWFAAA
jgi:hypothetical protein